MNYYYFTNLIEPSYIAKLAIIKHSVKSVLFIINR